VIIFNILVKKKDMFGINKDSVTQHNYNISFAIAICEGKVDNLLRIYINGKQISNTDLNYRFYSGCESQLPDMVIENHLGKGNVPAYRGLCYIVIENFNLKNYNNIIPKFEFEVKKRCLYRKDNIIPLEDKIEDMVIIPGSGEFVYDTELQYKQEGRFLGNKWVDTSSKKPINQNNDNQSSDSVLSTQDLLNECDNLKWSAPVVGWFANSTKLSEIEILPGIEFRHNFITKPDNWSVGHFNRTSAYQISQDQDGAPNYGGTSSDGSILRYLSYLRSKNLKIMFYPMLYLDTAGKPWRGHLTGSSEDVKDFFNKQNGYRNFILHYAKLVSGKVDAFLIGSEFVGLTKIKDQRNEFTAVLELIRLAKDVKNILGSNVKISYAADWSEYHHTDGGWYHLDKLWACPYIDFVGIDAYFPLTNNIKENYNEEQIIKGWQQGEGYDYYYDNNIKKTLSPEYAWKNIKYWWENEHINPNGDKTSWQPKMKKIWFTELGFPSVDCAANQPNIFYNKTSIDAGFPRNSTGSIDFNAQYSALNASIDYLNKCNFIERKFIWCWDSRPYPFWPDLDNIWKDGDSWSRGHWLNGKIGNSSLAAILLYFCKIIGIAEDKIHLIGIKDTIDGIFIKQDSSAANIINILQQIYHFDVLEYNNNIYFVKHGSGKLKEIDLKNLISQSRKNRHFLKMDKVSKNIIPNKVEITYYDVCKKYSPELYKSINNKGLTKNISLAIALICSGKKAKILADNIMKYYKSSSTVYQFIVPILYLDIRIGDFIKILYKEKSYIMMRVINISILSEMMIKITAESYDNSYLNCLSYSIDKYEVEIIKDSKSKLHFLKPPQLPFEDNDNDRLLIAVEKTSDNNNLTKIKLTNNDIIFLQNNILGFIVNHKNDEVVLVVKQGELDIDKEYLIYIDQEIIQIEVVKKIEKNIYHSKILQRSFANTDLTDDIIDKIFFVLDYSLYNYQLSSKLDKEKIRIIE
jgi:hypothetical protein